jgi:hypothetical protein
LDCHPGDSKAKIYRITILPVVFMGENVVAHTEGERRLRVFENRVLGSIFGPKREEIAGEWRKTTY